MRRRPCRAGGRAGPVVGGRLRGGWGWARACAVAERGDRRWKKKMRERREVREVERQEVVAFITTGIHRECLD
jgi:hypothetical protein